MNLRLAMTKQQTVTGSSAVDFPANLLSDEVTYWLGTGDLPPQLITGHALIDHEHRFLIGAIANLRRICVDQARLENCISCDQERQVRCENNLIGLLGDVFAFILDHFKTEENVMRDSMLLIVDREMCQAHMEDHAEIAAKVQEIVAALDSVLIVSRIRELDALLARWVTNHVALHDMLLSRWAKRDISLLRHL